MNLIITIIIIMSVTYNVADQVLNTELFQASPYFGLFVVPTNDFFEESLARGKMHCSVECAMRESCLAFTYLSHGSCLLYDNHLKDQSSVIVNPDAFYLEKYISPASRDACSPDCKRLDVCCAFKLPNEWLALLSADGLRIYTSIEDLCINSVYAEPIPLSALVPRYGDATPNAINTVGKLREKIYIFTGPQVYCYAYNSKTQIYSDLCPKWASDSVEGKTHFGHFWHNAETVIMVNSTYAYFIENSDVLTPSGNVYKEDDPNNPYPNLPQKIEASIDLVEHSELILITESSDYYFYNKTNFIHQGRVCQP